MRRDTCRPVFTVHRQHAVQPTAAEAAVGVMRVNQCELTSTENSGLSYRANLAFIHTVVMLKFISRKTKINCERDIVAPILL